MKEFTMNDKDIQKLKETDFKEFKALFPFEILTHSHAINVLLDVRSHLELMMSQTYNQVKDAHKKHQWLNQKLNYLFKINSLLLMKQAVQKQIAEIKERAEKGEDLSKEEQHELDMSMTAKDETPVNGFREIPGTES